MLKFGFELEGFYGDTEITVPPKEYPTDGFPGLVEFRSTGAKDIKQAYADIILAAMFHPVVQTNICEHIFSGKDRATLRRRHEVKSAWDIRNLYGRNPRLLGNKTIASLQINISEQRSNEYTDNKGFHAASYGLLDIPRIIEALDVEFADEIKEAKRQPGEYCVKDGIRLEYRSLPNFVFPFEAVKAKEFIERIEKCIK